MHSKKTGETIGFPPKKNPPDDAQVLFAAIRWIGGGGEMAVEET